MDPLDEFADDDFADKVLGTFVQNFKIPSVTAVTEYYSDGEPVKLVFLQVSVDGNDQLDGIHHTLDEALRNKFEGIVTTVMRRPEFSALLQGKHKYIVAVQSETTPESFTLRVANSSDDL